MTTGETSRAPADSDTDQDGVPDNPFITLTDENTLWLAEVSDQTTGERKTVAALRWDEPARDATDTLSIDLELVRPDGTRQRVLLEIPREILVAGETGVVLLSVAPDPVTLLGAKEVGLPQNVTKSCFGFPMVMNPHDSDTLFVVPQESDEYRFVHDGQLAVYRTIDAGETWRRMANGLPGDHFTGVLRQAMAIDDWDENGVYFGTTGGRIFFSRNDGENWQAMPCQLPRIASVSAFTLKT